MSELITKDDGTPFATVEAAKSKRTRMGKEGMDTNVVKVDGGYVLEKMPYEKPKKRIPIGQRNVLTFRKEDLDSNKVYRVVNDEPGRIRMFRDAGWNVTVRRDGLEIGDPDVGAGSQLGSLVTKTVGKEQIGYLMEIPKEYYEEDQEAKAKNIRQHESALKMEKKEPDTKGQYGSVKIGKRVQY